MSKNKLQDVWGYTVMFAPLLLFFFIKWYWVILIYNILLTALSIIVWKHNTNENKQLRKKFGITKVILLPLFFNVFGLLYLILKMGDAGILNDKPLSDVSSPNDDVINSGSTLNEEDEPKIMEDNTQQQNNIDMGKIFYRIEYTSGGESCFIDREEPFYTSRYELLELESDDDGWMNGGGDILDCLDEFYIDVDNKLVDIAALEEVHGEYEYDIGSGTHDEGEYEDKEKAIEEFNKLKEKFKKEPSGKYVPKEDNIKVGKEKKEKSKYNYDDLKELIKQLKEYKPKIKVSASEYIVGFWQLKDGEDMPAEASEISFEEYKKNSQYDSWEDEDFNKDKKIYDNSYNNDVEALYDLDALIQNINDYLSDENRVRYIGPDFTEVKNDISWEGFYEWALDNGNVDLCMADRIRQNEDCKILSSNLGYPETKNNIGWNEIWEIKSQEYDLKIIED